MSRIDTVDELLDILAGFEVAYDDGPIDLLQHSLNCGHQLALRRPSDIELQVAGLVHDIGHAFAPDDDCAHGAKGAAAARDLLGERVATLIELHVPAKRYLITVDARYARLLSPNARRAVQLQGGPMSHDEVIAFEDRRWSSDAMILRMADDDARRATVVPPLVTWRAALEQLAGRRALSTR